MYSVETKANVPHPSASAAPRRAWPGARTLGVLAAACGLLGVTLASLPDPSLAGALTGSLAVLIVAAWFVRDFEQANDTPAR